MTDRLRPWAILSLLGFLSFLGATYDWFDADEFVNLQQAQRANDGQALYVETPGNHPPLYTEWVLRPLVALGGTGLLAARIAGAAMIWATGLLVADLLRQERDIAAARWFLTLWTLNGFALLAGTRAMNEGPLTLLLATAAYALRTRRLLPLAGVAASAAVFTRYTAAFYLPALVPRDARRLLGWIAWGGVAMLALLAWFLLRSPDNGAALVRWTLAFHAERTPEEWVRRVGKTVWWSGALFLAAIARPLAVFRRPIGAWSGLGIAAMAGALLMVLLPTTHVHYFLPCAVLVTVGAALAFSRINAQGRRRIMVAGFFLMTASQGIFYVPQTPHHGLQAAQAEAAWIRQATPVGMDILTDAPQYAILASRGNWHGYYWALRQSLPPADLRSAPNETSVVAVSERFGHFDRGFPADFLAQLATLPCKRFEGVHVYWTGAAGPAPADFADAC